MSRSFVSRRLPRRSFLRGAAGVSLALPFLESLPERSAWAADDAPSFSLFICGVGGVITERFFPDTTGALTAEGLASAGKATSQLSRHAERLLFVSGIDSPISGTDAHRDGLIAAYTGRAPVRGSEDARCLQPTPCLLAGGRSADWEVCERLAPGSEPLVLYYGNRGFTGEMLSSSSAGRFAPAIVSPHELFLKLVGLSGVDGAVPPGSEEVTDLLLTSRRSIHDLVRDELRELMAQPRLSVTDKRRLQDHFDSIRDAEGTFGGMATEAQDWCHSGGLNLGLLESLKEFKYDRQRTEEMILLHLSLVALAFSCNLYRSASLQWGDAYDQSVYAVPSNERGWTLSQISHQAQSDSLTGDDPLALQAHAEIDELRMRTLAAGLDHFEQRELGERCVVSWTNQYTGGVRHSSKSVPHIIWGSPGGHLKQGAYVDAGAVGNNRLLNALITAALQGTGQAVVDFGEGQGGELELVLA